MRPDARRTPRSVVSLDLNRGMFLVKAGHQQFRLRQVDNVSPSGASLCLPAELEPGTTLTMTYSEKDWQVTVVGDVVWAKPADETAFQEWHPANSQPFRIGVSFRTTQPEDNALFFLALRERLDPFTWV